MSISKFHKAREIKSLISDWKLNLVSFSSAFCRLADLGVSDPGKVLYEAKNESDKLLQVGSLPGV